MPELGDQPIEERFREDMNAIARALDEILNPGKRGAARKVGFVLLVFPYGDDSGRCNYISNGADRRDIAVLLREQARRFEGGAEVGPGRA